LASTLAGRLERSFENCNYSFVLKTRFDGDIPVSQLKRNDEPKLIWKSENRQTLAELFIGFLRFFAKDFR
jgi:hypothetical protein